MKIGITGIKGLIGSHLSQRLLCLGHQVVGFSRSPSPKMRAFSPNTTPDVHGLDAIVHLAGEPILGLWTQRKMDLIRQSRILGTHNIARAIQNSKSPPKILISASAIGFYGDTGENPADESSPPGNGFLAQICQDWEAEALAAKKFGTRVVCLRIGFVLAEGGAMKFILPIFRLGLGGPLGNGHQWMSLIHINDVIGLIIHCLHQDQLTGPVNAVMPEPIRNIDFTKALARAVHRPAVFPVPKILIRTALGGLSHVMLDSTRVLPKIAMQSKYQWEFPTAQHAINSIAKCPLNHSYPPPSRSIL